MKIICLSFLPHRTGSHTIAATDLWALFLQSIFPHCVSDVMEAENRSSVENAGLKVVNSVEHIPHGQQNEKRK
jgi:hypothetical protein